MNTEFFDKTHIRIKEQVVDSALVMGKSRNGSNKKFLEHLKKEFLKFEGKFCYFSMNMNGGFRKIILKKDGSTSHLIGTQIL